MTAHTSPRRTFVGSADVAPGGASTEPVTRGTSEAISHPVPLKPLLTREDWRAARESILLGPPVSPRCVVQWFGIPGCACDDPYHSAGRHHCRCGNEWFDGEDAEMVMRRLNPHNDQDKDYINRLMYLSPCRYWFPEGASTGYLEETVKPSTRESVRSAA